MHYESFGPQKNFTAKSRGLIQQADQIISDYRSAGYILSLRQLYYQFVARGIIPNTERSYKNLGNLVTDGRLAGLLPWDGIEDRNRGISGWLIEEDEQTIVDELPRGYAVDMWAKQDTYVEVWVEKDALSSVIQRACSRFRVPYMACKGYLSASEAFRAGQRMAAQADEGKRCLIVHLGDHDPSGIDMTRDNYDRGNLFSYDNVEISRIALNMDQIEEYGPPPNPAKVTDSRAEDYIARFGDESWELDALEPSVVEQLVRGAIEPLIDWDVWDDDLEREAYHKAVLSGVGEDWEAHRERIIEDKGLEDHWDGA